MRFVCARVVLPLLAVPLLWGCSGTSSPDGPSFTAVPEPWRAVEEQACLSSGIVHESSFLRGRSALGGPSVCGADKPFEMAAADGGRVQMNPPALLRCPMIPQVDHWVRNVVEPAALNYLGSPITELTVAASYSCRPINHIEGNKLSEHGHANAVDISKFILADGHTITVKGGWNGTSAERAFLQAAHDGACTDFTTVLGPGADSHHSDHFHLDLARHGRDGLYRVCK